MLNEVKIKSALLDVIEYMREDGCTELEESIKHKGKRYYVIIGKGKNERRRKTNQA